MTSPSLYSEQSIPSPSAGNFPSCVQLTLVHYICNCKCISCPVGIMNRSEAEGQAQFNADGGKKLFMSWKVFEKAARETGRHAESFLRLHARGEPTLHPQFVEMISFAKQAGVSTVQVFTNGILVDETMAARLLEAGLDIIEFSIHGHRLTYETLMGNGKFDRVVQNVQNFVALRNKLHRKTRVVVSAVDQPGFQPDKQAHRQFWTGQVDQVILRPFHSWGGRIPCEPVGTTSRRHACPQLWTRLTVGPTGNLLYCFNSWDEPESEIAANLLDETVTLESAWQSEQYARVRELHLSGDYTLDCCAKCSDWVGSAWGANSYESLIQKLNAQSESETTGESC